MTIKTKMIFLVLTILALVGLIGLIVFFRLEIFAYSGNALARILNN